MSWSYVGSSTVWEDSGGHTSQTLYLPASLTAGDIVIGCFSFRYSPSPTWTTIPSGWTLLDDTTYSNVRLATFWYKATGSDPSSVTFVMSASTTAHTCSVSGAFRGADGTSPINQHSIGSGATTTTPVSPGVTTTVDGCLIIPIVGTLNDAMTITVPSGTTQGFNTAATGNYQYQPCNACGYVTQATAGATGTYTWTDSVSTDTIGAIIALAPSSTSHSQSVTATASWTASIARQIAHTVAATVTATVTASKAVSFALNAGRSFAASLVPGSAHLMSMSASRGFTAVLTSGSAFFKSIVASRAFSATISRGRGYAKSVVAAATFAASLVASNVGAPQWLTVTSVTRTTPYTVTVLMSTTPYSVTVLENLG